MNLKTPSLSYALTQFFQVSSSIGKDGVLTITAPRVSAPEQPRITHNTSNASNVGHRDIEQRMDRVLSPSNWEDNFQTSRRDSGSSAFGTGNQQVLI